MLNRFHTEHSLLLLCSSTINHYNILKTVQEFSSVDTFWAKIGMIFPLFLPQKRRELGSLCSAFCFPIFSMQFEAEISFNMLWGISIWKYKFCLSQIMLCIFDMLCRTFKLCCVYGGFPIHQSYACCSTNFLGTHAKGTNHHHHCFYDPDDWLNVFMFSWFRKHFTCLIVLWLKELNVSGVTRRSRSDVGQ